MVKIFPQGNEGNHKKTAELSVQAGSLEDMIYSKSPEVHW